MPLVNADMSPFEWGKYRELTLHQLVGDKILPAVDGLYKNDKPSIAAVLLSHAHLDHYGFLQFVHPDIPLYMSIRTKPQKNSVSYRLAFLKCPEISP